MNYRFVPSARLSFLFYFLVRVFFVCAYAVGFGMTYPTEEHRPQVISLSDLHGKTFYCQWRMLAKIRS